MPTQQLKLPYGSQWIDEEDIAAVIANLRSDRITQGPVVNEFEKKFAEHVGAKYAVAVANGTAALHLVALALGIKEGDEVITTPITFLATANAALYCGGKPVFADIDSDTICIDPAQVEKKITSKTKAVFAVHFGGCPADLENLSKLCKKHNLILVEDACHALGAKYKGEFIGNSKYSKAAIFSFHPVKHITTGEGGMITTNDPAIYEKLILLRTHGVTSDESKFQNPSEGPWVYEMQELGFNYRITDFQAALGISQLSKLNDFVSRRRQIAQKYTEAFQNLNGLVLQKEGPDGLNSHHLYVIQFKLDQCCKSKKEIFEMFKEAGIGVQVHYIPIPKQPYYQQRGYSMKGLPAAEAYYQSAISLPIFPKMTDEQVDFVIEIVKNILKTVLK